jgi:hypothetical protein
MRFFVLLVLLTITMGSLARAIVPDVYFSAGYLNSESKITVKDIDTTSEKISGNGALVSLGIRPLDLPIIGGFRGELQYFGVYSGDIKNNAYGFAIYYDFFRFIPIVNPYIGVSYYSNKYSFSESVDYNKKSLVSMNAGLNVSIPVLPIDIFAEYRRVGESFDKAFNTPNGININKNEYIIGMRYYILK